MSKQGIRWRRLIGLLAIGLVVWAVYGWNRGLRYPPLQFDPHPRTNEARQQGVVIAGQGAYFVERDESGLPIFRAFHPEPELQLDWSGSTATSVEFWLQNVHPEAEETGAESESGPGCLRRLSVSRTETASSSVSFDFPQRERYRFGVFGDAGGGAELDFCFARCAELGADFILHLGDIAYLETDFEDSLDAFAAATVPVYTTIGNHDFHGGHRYRFNFFMQYIGPLNYWFLLDGVLFLNLDTAGDTIPYSGGQRGTTLAAVESEQPGRMRLMGARDWEPELIVFTHRPLEDPRVLRGGRGKPHALNRTGEAEWLRTRLLALGADALLAGHIHHTFDYEHKGLRTIISGAGLGDEGEKARLLIGEFEANGSVEFHWEPLGMPAKDKPGPSGLRKSQVKGNSNGKQDFEPQPSEPGTE